MSQFGFRLIKLTQFFPGGANQYHWEAPFDSNYSLLYYFLLRDNHSGNAYETPKFSFQGIVVSTASSNFGSDQSIFSLSTAPQTSATTPTQTTSVQRTPTADPASTSHAANTNHPNDSNRLDNGAIIGISIGVAALIVLSIIAILLYRRRSSTSAGEAVQVHQKFQLNNPHSSPIAQLDSRPISYELSGHVTKGSAELDSN